MSNQKTPAQSPSCSAPEINRLIAAYGFGRASKDEQKTLEVHLLECDYCWQEVQRLEHAVHVLSSERSVIDSLSASDAGAVLGMSARLESSFGGHTSHILISCLLYAGLYCVTMLIEIAYRFDIYGRTAVSLLPVVFSWILATSAAALALDWRRTSKGRGYGLGLSLLVFLSAAGLLYLALTLFLPPLPVTELTVPSSSAQSAYLKDSVYSFLLVLIFLTPTFHFIVAMQRELHLGRHRLALELLTGSKFSFAPKGAIYLGLWMLMLPVMAMATYSAFSTRDLLGQLKPSLYQNLFTSLIWLRLILYYGLTLKCITWYHRAVNILKLECLLAEKIPPS